LDAVARYKRSLDVARKIGVPYTPAAGLAVSPVERIVERFERLDGKTSRSPSRSPQSWAARTCPLSCCRR
jgi:hypothetical protein